MDTREKIIDLAKAAEIAAGLRGSGARLKLVAAYFDVLTADRVRRLGELADGHPLMVAVLDAPDPLLTARARAELAAALRMVDYVLLLDGTGLEEALGLIQPAEVIGEETADRLRTQALIEHVQRRQRG
jgi:hypothetical protein